MFTPPHGLLLSPDETAGWLRTQGARAEPFPSPEQGNLVLVLDAIARARLVTLGFHSNLVALPQRTVFAGRTPQGVRQCEVFGDLSYFALMDGAPPVLEYSGGGAKQGKAYHLKPEYLFATTTTLANFMSELRERNPHGLPMVERREPTRAVSSHPWNDLGDAHYA